MKGVILAGGEGTRLYPLTCKVPKALVPIVNRPFLTYTLSYLKQHEIDNIYLTLRFLADMIREYFGDGGEFGVSLEYEVEEIGHGSFLLVTRAGQTGSGRQTAGNTSTA